MPTSTFAAGDTDYIAKLNELANASFTFSKQTANFSAAKGFLYGLDTNALTITMPATPTVGDRIRFVSTKAAVVTATLARNGSNINSVAADATVGPDSEAVYVDSTVGWRVVPLIAGRDQLVINGDFDIAQRAATYALTTSVAYGSVDRWAFKQATTAAGIANQVDAQALGFVGFKNALKLGRNSGATSTGIISAQSAFETLDAVKWQGKTVVLEFRAKAGANFSSASSVLTAKLFTGTGTDQTVISMEAGTWTGSATPINTAQVITTSPGRYQLTVTLATTITQLGIQFSYTPVGTAGADDNVYITGIRLREAAVAPAVEARHYTAELELCRHYYRRIKSSVSNNQYFAAGFCYATTDAALAAIIGPVMRATPTIAFSAAGDMLVFSGAGVSTALTNLTNLGSGPDFVGLHAIVASGLTVGQGALLYLAAATGKWVDFSAEL